MKYDPPVFEGGYVGAPLKIVCAANRYGEIVVPSARHHDVRMRDVIRRLGGRSKLLDQCEREEQGFIDQYGKWWSREDAKNIVIQNEQPLRSVPTSGRLYSENLY